MTKKEFQEFCTRYIPGWFDPYGCKSMPDMIEGRIKLYSEMREWDPKLVDMIEEHSQLEDKILDYIKSRQDL